ncbi:MAG: hypothetical protein ACYS8W_07835 [Planctomycetota bacterium]|jgi:hypothetical protein
MDTDLPDDYMEKTYLKRALRAFKKRLKSYKLDDESKLGGSPLTGGRSSSIVAIKPPDSFPQEAWDKLVELGRLRTENGLYELVPQEEQ